MRPNGLRYLPVGGRELLLLYGKIPWFRTSNLSGQNPTSQVHALLGGVLLYKTHNCKWPARNKIDKIIARTFDLGNSLKTQLIKMPMIQKWHGEQNHRQIKTQIYERLKKPKGRAINSANRALLSVFRR